MYEKLWGKLEARDYTIKSRVLIILMGSLVPVILFLILYNVFMIQEMNEKIAESSGNILYIQCQNLEKNMAGIENAMINITAEQPYFKSLAYGPAGEYENYINAYETCDTVSNMMYPYSDWWGSVVISVPKGIYRILGNEAYGAKVSGTEILSYLQQLADEGRLPTGNIWHSVKCGDDSFLIRIIGYQDTYLIGIINLNDVILMQNNEKDNEAATIFYDDEQIYTNAQLLNLDSLQIKDGYSFVRINGKRYMLTESGLGKSNLKVAYVTPEVTMLKGLSRGHIFLLIISACMILVIPVSYKLMKRLFFRSLDSLVDRMEQIKEGEREFHLIPDGQGREFVKVYQAMNDMVTEITNLRIESYEKEIQINKTQLEYYQIQIRPHFYLNCLKNIYGMLEVGYYKDVQRTIILLSKHLRYMLQEIRGLVEIKEELQFIHNYMELQQIGRENKPECGIECEETLEEFKIPAVSLLSFVENSVKYSGNDCRTLRISIIIEVLKTEAESLVHIRITDNGQGYKEDILKQLNQKGRIEGTEHIGINNVIQRFKLQFGDRVFFAFGNYEGAETEIFIKTE